jgi:D-amino-acid dehydrogenase
MGRTPLQRLWINAGHGTLGWTHGAGSGKALAELISGEQPEMNFSFYGLPRTARSTSQQRSTLDNAHSRV